MKIEKKSPFCYIEHKCEQQLVGLVVGSQIGANIEDPEIAPDKKNIIFERDVGFFQIFLESWTVSGKGLDKVQITNATFTPRRRKEEDQVLNSTEEKQKMSISEYTNLWLLKNNTKQQQNPFVHDQRQ